jgi:hypothetical protein
MSNQQYRVARRDAVHGRILQLTVRRRVERKARDTITTPKDSLGSSVIEGCPFYDKRAGFKDGTRLANAFDHDTASFRAGVSWKTR